MRCRRKEREETWGGVYPHHPTRHLGEHRSSPSGVGAEPRPKMDFMHIWGQKEAIWNTLFSIFERRRGPSNVTGPGKTFPPFPPSRQAWPWITCLMYIIYLLLWLNIYSTTDQYFNAQTDISYEQFKRLLKTFLLGMRLRNSFCMCRHQTPKEGNLGRGVPSPSD